MRVVKQVPACDAKQVALAGIEYMNDRDLAKNRWPA
jgi:hypothetical protein